MVLDIKKMREKKAAAEGKKTAANSSVNFWSPVEGNSTVRILPPDESGDPFKEIFQHFGVAGPKVGFVCPKRQFNEKCAVCDYVSDLYKSGAEDEKTLAKSIKAKARYYSRVIVRGAEEEGVKVWGYPPTVYNKFLDWTCDPEVGDFTDESGETGTDVKLSVAKVNGATWATTTPELARKPSPLSANKAMAQEWVSTEIDFDKIFERKSSEQVDKILYDFINGTEGGDESSSTEKVEVVEEKKTVATSEKKVKAKSLQDLKKELEDDE